MRPLLVAVLLGLWSCLPVAVQAQTTITKSVAASTDDAEESGPDATGSHLPAGYMDLTSSDIELIRDFDTAGGYSGGTQKIGLRFTAMTIPAGATITSAYLTFRAIAADAPMTNSEATSLTIKAQLASNATTFTSTNGNISGRTLTTASTSWAPGTWTTGTDYNSPSLVSVIQEVVSQGGWASGNAIAIIITGTGHRSGPSYDSAPATAAKLVVTYTLPKISGTVFEDANYGGGAGRDSATAAGVGRSGARIELYNGSGVYVTSTTSQTGGAYAFTGLAAGNYTVRVVNDSVSSSRTGYVTSLKRVQTYRTNASSGAAVAVTDYVGGQNPAVADAAAGSAGATLNTTTGVFSVGPSGTAQSITNVTLGASNIADVDFGYSFNVIVNTNNTGQGSLRQFITNGNTLGGDASLAQSGLVAAKENAVFMISNGTAAPGLRAANNYFTSGIATIAPTTVLPDFSTLIVLDATTQPGFGGTPIVEVDGVLAPLGTEGLRLAAGSAGSSLAGLMVNRFSGRGIEIVSDNNFVRGSYIGTNGAAARGNGEAGIYIDLTAAGNRIGGVAASDANRVSNSGWDGVRLNGTGINNAFLGNWIVGNGEQGIDIGVQGTTPNDAGDPDTGGNGQQNFPLLASAVTSGGNTRIIGTLNSMPATTFRIEFFSSTLPDASGHGEGETYLGATSVTTDLAGDAPIDVTLASVSVPAGDAVTSTATVDLGGGNYGGTSEFSAITLASTATISGTVFEDANYGGGAGRDSATAAGVGRPSARVELYNGSGVYVTSTTSQTGGAYAFPGLTAGNYTVRVVNDSVSSARTGYVTSLKRVQTYRTNASTGTMVAVTDHVGGQNPAVADAAAGSAGATLNTTTGVFSAGPSGTAQSITNVTVSASNVTDVDFGYSFDVIVNTNNTGQGSLRQFITNANTLGGDASLAQSGLVAAKESAVFMISNGTAAAGLRAANNYFSGGGATISPAPALPPISTAVILNAQKQPGWTSAPIVELAGNLAGALANGLELNSGSEGSVVQGLVVNLFSDNGITGTADSILVAGNYVGTDISGTLDRGNIDDGIETSGDYWTIGAATATGRNVVSGNNDNGILLNSDGHTVVANFVGTNASGTAPLGNGDEGIEMTPVSQDNVVGGTGALAGNIVSGNGGDGMLVNNSPNNQIIGNIIGLDVGGTIDLGNSGAGVRIQGGASGNTVGGTNPGSGNVISENGGDGVSISDAGTGNRVLGNAVYANGNIGIDQLDNGVTANDGVKTAGQPNLLMDHPVFTSATLAGTSLTVAGYVGSAANQATFANARVEVFESDGDALGFGEGRTYLDFLTTDANGNFSGSLDVTGKGLLVGEKLSGTATDGTNNTSEFGASFTVTAAITVSGTVFEDANYGGGAGRDSATAAGVGRSGARVELYNGSGVYVTATTSQAAGAYAFTGLAAGNYTVRVVNDSVSSVRTGYGTSLKRVQTYRTNASTGTAVAVTDHVGGQNPAVADAAAGSAGATLNTTTGVFSAGPSGTAQSITNVTVSASNVTDVDFGYSFDVIVNTNNTGQGSLRQFITNANTLGGDASLAQSGLVAAKENAVFMISNGTAAAGLRAANNYFSGGVAQVSPNPALPSIATSMAIDAQTQPGFAGSPVVRIDGAGAGVGASGFSVAAGGARSSIRGLMLTRFSSNGVLVESGARGVTIAGNWIGTNGTGATTLGNTIAGIELQGDSTLVGGPSVLDRNTINNNPNEGINVTGAGAIGNVIRGNFVGLEPNGVSGAGNGDVGIALLASGGGGNVIGGTNVADRNVISRNYEGIEINCSNNVVQGNYFGTDSTGVEDLGQTSSDAIQVANSSSGNLIGGTTPGAGNLIAFTKAGRHGVNVQSGTGNPVRGNRIHSNTGIGIDLGDNGVSSNNGTKSGALPNSGMDHPVFTSALLGGTTLSVAGYVGSAPGQATFGGAVVEVFRSDVDGSGFGEGPAYLGTLTADGSGNFSGTLTVSGLAVGDRISGTATDGSNNTSEFGANATVVTLLGLSKRAFDSNGNAVASGTTLAKGALVNFLVYVDNRGSAVTDVRLSDVLEPGFAYVPGTMRSTNAPASCAATPCTAPEESAILAAALAGTPLTDAVDGDTGALSGVTLQLGKANAGSARLDIATNKVYAIVFRARIR